MPSQQDIQQLQERLAAHRETLATLLTQRAQLGSAYAPPGVASGIREAREEIRRIKESLHGWGVVVEDLPDDGAVPAPPSVEAQPHAGLPIPDPVQAPPKPSTTPPTDIATLWRQALAAYLMKQWPQAETLLTQVAKRDPGYRDVQARLTEARRQIELQRFYRDLCALRDADQWLAVLDGLAELEQRQPTYPDPQELRVWAEARQREQRYDVALVAADQGNWLVAIAELEALLTAVPDDAEAQALLSHARAEHGNQSIPKYRQQTSYNLIEMGNFAEASMLWVSSRGRRIYNLIEIGYFGEALDLLTDTLHDVPSDREAAAFTAQIIETPAVPFSERLRAAELVGEVGDPRIPVEVAQWQAELARRNETFGKPAGYWCYVPQRSYQIGGWEPKQQPASFQLLTFWIARYPITVAQYAPFVEVGYGTDAERWWTPEGWRWKQSRQHIEPRYWRSWGYSRANQPVIGVTWYEVTAYCAWLSDRLQDVLFEGYVVRLPTEAEWEAAAAFDASGQRRPYPWGEETPTPERAIYDESKLNYPAPVGCCPSGAAACGAFDLAGNVWEWTTSHFERYPVQSGEVITDFKQSKESTPDEIVVPLRGGSSGNDGIYARCGARGCYHPTYNSLYNDAGMRVCLSSRLSKHSG